MAKATHARERERERESVYAVDCMHAPTRMCARASERPQADTGKAQRAVPV